MKFGFVAILGPTNSGKSTLLNRIMGKKLSPVSILPQTSYGPIRGILNFENGQAVFVDTPGFQKHRQLLPRLLNQVALNQMRACDSSIWVFDVNRKRVRDEIVNWTGIQKSNNRKRICALNKIDKLDKKLLLPMIDVASQLNLFTDIIPISASTGDGIPGLVKTIFEGLEEGPALYPPGMVTDRPNSYLFAEWIREKIYETTREEVPYSTRVEVLSIDDEAIPKIHATIHVDAPSRRGIIIGKGGQMLRKIGSRASVDLDWKNNKQLMKQLLEL